MLIQVLKEILQDLNDKFLNAYYRSFQKHQPKCHSSTGVFQIFCW